MKHPLTVPFISTLPTYAIIVKQALDRNECCQNKDMDESGQLQESYSNWNM